VDSRQRTYLTLANLGQTRRRTWSTEDGDFCWSNIGLSLVKHKEMMLLVNYRALVGQTMRMVIGQTRRRFCLMDSENMLGQIQFSEENCEQDCLDFVLCTCELGTLVERMAHREIECT